MFSLTCLPGLACTPAVFDALGAELAVGMRALALPDGEDFAELARGLAARVPDGTVLCGMSMGAYLALEIARIAPEKPRGLILVGATARADTPDAATMRGKVADWARRKGAAALASAQADALLAPANRDRSDLRQLLLDMATQVGVESFARHQAALAARSDQMATLSDVRCPTLVLAGAQDTVNPPAVARALADALPAGRYREIEGAGHLPVIEAPVAVAGEVEAFLSTLTTELSR